MPRDIPIGNGNLLIAFDKDYLLREFYFPYVGEENHTKGEKFRLGFWIEGSFSWLPDQWIIRKDYLPDSLVTNVSLKNDFLKLSVIANDVVDFQENIYLKKLEVENLSEEEREVRIFLAQDFHIYGDEVGDTAEFRPEINSLLHYKKERYFLINIFAKEKFGIEYFATGNKEITDFEGSWKDAEDGFLSQNPIAQGSVDSVVGIHLNIKGKSKESCYYWICVGKNWEEVKALNDLLKRKKPEFFLLQTLNFWKLWVNKEPLNTTLLPENILELYKKSLLVIRTHINNCGSIISGNDSDVTQFNRDTYSYLWPRDGAFIAHALDLAGYGSTQNFFNFCAKIIEREGYFLHKYTPSGLPGSSWHPWLEEKSEQLPIQEDETAIVIWALWKHYEIYKDIEFIKPLYKNLIKRAADFMMNYRDFQTGLPLPSYDLWEERRGVFTFTVAAVYGGLISGARFAEAFGETILAQKYREGAFQMRKALESFLYLKSEKRFAKMINFKKDGYEVDRTIDSSLSGIFLFEVYNPDDEKVKNTMDQIYARLWRDGGGLCRYENDGYYRITKDDIGNPWFITTLWFAQYQIALAKEKKDLEKPMKIMQWVVDHSLPSGVLAEQINPKTGEPLSISPLTWSQGAFITVVQKYLDKLVEIEICPDCGQSKILKKQKINQSKF
jgi:glucoamylase